MSLSDLRPTQPEREQLWHKVIEIIERYLVELPLRPVKAVDWSVNKGSHFSGGSFVLRLAKWHIGCFHLLEVVARRYGQ